VKVANPVNYGHLQVLALFRKKCVRSTQDWKQELLQELIRPRGIEIPEEVGFTGLPRSGLGFPAAALVFSASLRNLVQK
jgi:hypothetical protein